MLCALLLPLLYFETGVAVLAFTTTTATTRTTTTTTIARPPSATTLWRRTDTILDAKKGRRRKDKSAAASPSSSSSTPPMEEDDLPDFDIAEEAPIDQDNAAAAVTTKKANTAANQVIGTTPQGETITAAMMGSTSLQQAKSVRDLINDRSLEQKLQFDDTTTNNNNNNDNAGAQELPDLMQMAGRGVPQNSTTDTVPMSKKKARQAARQAAAARANQDESSSLDALLASVPFFVNEKGQVSAIKILEAGTWTGIALLVAWEIYLNSPLFERAAPMVRSSHWMRGGGEEKNQPNTCMVMLDSHPPPKIVFFFSIDRHPWCISFEKKCKPYEEVSVKQ